MLALFRYARTELVELVKSLIFFALLATLEAHSLIEKIGTYVVTVLNLPQLIWL